MKPFDFNNDGKVDPIEKGLEYHIYQEVEKELNEENSNQSQTTQNTYSTNPKLSTRKIIGVILLGISVIVGFGCDEQLIGSVLLIVAVLMMSRK